MTFAQANHVAGVLLILGGICFLIWGSAYVIPPLLLGAGIWVVHLRQSGEAGALGSLGIVLVILGLVLGAALQSLSLIWPALVMRAFPTNALIIGVILSFGMATFGVATVRAKVFPAAVGQLMSASPLLIILMGTWGARLAFLSFVVFGYLLLAGKFQHNGEPVERTS
jgi:hypothetical protein